MSKTKIRPGVYLYPMPVSLIGTNVNGKAKPPSDIDVCLVSPKFQKPIETMRFLWQ